MDRNDALWQLVDQARPSMSDVSWKEQYNNLLKLPINPSITPEAKALLDNLYFLQGKRIITGQHEYLEAPYTYAEQVRIKTGKYPLLKGVEFGGITSQTPETLAAQRQGVVNAAKAWHDAGGIVTATYHQVYPGTALTWPNVQRATTKAEFDELVTPGTALYEALIVAIDEVAEYLKQLRDCGVPVLWRPYHEMNGGWFWWGKKSNFAELWEIMYQRYTHYHGLNNLLWVWSANANNQWCEPAANYYVGHNRADALGMDIYNNEYYYSNYYELIRLAEGKIISITENGQMPDMDKCLHRQFKYSWFMTWGNYLTNNEPNHGRWNTDETIVAVYNHPYALNRGDAYDPDKIMPSMVADGLMGKYYLGQEFNTLKVSKIVPTVNFNWLGGTTINSWNMTVRWTGYLEAIYDEDYTIYVESSDGVRLWVDNLLVIDDWAVHGTAEVSAVVRLAAGKQHNIKLEYFNVSDAVANIKLSWSSASQAKEVIPQAQLYSV
ncbi:Mannan endo-1,4-beta-mannosidase [compost metagenome]